MDPRNSKSVLTFFLLSVILPVSSAFAELPQHRLIELAERAEGPRVRYVLENGVQVGLTSDGKSYYVLWLPEGYSPVFNTAEAALEVFDQLRSKGVQ